MSAPEFVYWLSIAFFAGWYLGRRLNRKPPEVKITIDPELLKQIHARMIAEWLDAHGLTWMAKGADFKLGGAVKNERRD